MWIFSKFPFFIQDRFLCVNVLVVILFIHAFTFGGNWQYDILNYRGHRCGVVLILHPIYFIYSIGFKGVLCRNCRLLFWKHSIQNRPLLPRLWWPRQSPVYHPQHHIWQPSQLRISSSFGLLLLFAGGRLRLCFRPKCCINKQTKKCLKFHYGKHFSSNLRYVDY